MEESEIMKLPQVSGKTRAMQPSLRQTWEPCGALVGHSPTAGGHARQAHVWKNSSGRNSMFLKSAFLEF